MKIGREKTVTGMQKNQEIWDCCAAHSLRWGIGESCSQHYEMRMSVEFPTNFQQISGWLHNFQWWMYLPSGSGIPADTVTSPSSKTGGATGRASQLWSSGRKCSWPVIFEVSKGILQRAGWRALDSNIYYIHIYIYIYIFMYLYIFDIFHNPGAGPWTAGLCPCRRPSVGNRRL